MAEKHISAKIKSYFSAAANRQNLTSGEEIQTSFGKIAKWLSDLKTVAFTGSYKDLSNKPTIPTVNNGTLTIQKNGTNVATFTANQSGNATANITLAKADVGLTNVDNTSDANKPISTAAQAEFDKQQAQIDYNSNQGVKNLLYTKPITVTKNGVTATLISPNKYLISGTTTLNKSTVLMINNLSTGATTSDDQYPTGNPFGTGDFIVSGKFPEGIAAQIIVAKSLPLTDSPSNYRLYTLLSSTSERLITIDNTDKYVWLRLYYWVSTTTTYNNDEVEIMMRRAEIEDDTFEPYSEPNYQLTQKVDKALEQTGYNLFKITSFSNNVSNGITYTVNTATGIVTANGTVTSGNVSVLNLYLESNVFGDLNLSGCANGGSLSTYDVLPFDVTTSARPTNWAGTAIADSVFSESDVKEVKFIQGHTNIIQIRIRSGVTVSNLQFKPMLTKPELAGVPFQPYAMSNTELTQKALIPQGDYNTVSIDGGLNFETTDQTTLEVTDGNVVIESNKTKASAGEVNTYIIVNDRGHTGEYDFTPDGLKAYIPIAPDEDSRVSVFTLVPQADINHNGIFRGENLTNVWVENGKIKESLYTKIHSGDFSGLYLGDYFTVSITTDIYTKFTGSSFVSGTTYYTLSGEYPNWDYTATTDTAPTGGKMYFTKQTVTENVDLMIAAFDYYYNVGDTALISHHLVLIPKNYGFKTTAKMNSTNTTTGSYYNCEMHQFTLPCYAKSLKTVLNNHLLAHRTMLPNAINASIPSMAGAGLTGASSTWTWKTVELQLMSEPQIYGTTVWSSSAYDVGIDCKKLPIFDFINGVQYGRDTFWLRSVANSLGFALCGYHGNVSGVGASNAYCVRPLILFG